MHDLRCLFLTSLIGVLLLTGCDIKDKLYTPSQAENALVTFCQKEGGVDITTRAVEKTQWVYVPLEDPLFDIKASKGDKKTADRKSLPFSLLSLDGEFTDQKNFSMTYDIVPDVLPAEPQAYGMSYNDAYSKKKQLIYQGLQETFFNLKNTDAPLFFVIVMTDITKGIAIKTTLYLQDLKELLTGAIYEEYYYREVSEIISNEALIGDKKGRTIEYTPVRWSDFLTDQIKNRIRFKFTQSDFKPTEPDKEIVTIAANALKIYPFSDYNGLYLYNRRDKKEKMLTKEELTALATGPGREEQKGKTTVIHYSLKDGIQ